MRMLTYRMALDVAGGDRGAVMAQAAAIDTTLELLRAGDPSRPLFIPGSDEAQAELAGLRTQWSSLRSRWIGSAPAAVVGEARAFVDHIDRFGFFPRIVFENLLPVEKDRDVIVARGAQDGFSGFAFEAEGFAKETHLVVSRRCAFVVVPNPFGNLREKLRCQRGNQHRNGENKLRAEMSHKNIGLRPNDIVGFAN